MGYYVTTQGKNKLTLFLVNRKLTKSRWWVTDLSLAMRFDKKLAAEYSANRLRYKDPQVVGEKAAEQMESENSFINAELDEHPFSSEALGQD